MYHVLIVDDDPLAMHSLCRQIDWRRYTLDLAGTADSNEKALALLRRKAIDLLIADLRLPRADGLKLIAAAKRENPDLRVVMISAYREFDCIKQALLIGVENYLLKPIDQAELNRTLEKLIAGLHRERGDPAHGAPEPSAVRSDLLDRWVNAGIRGDALCARAKALGIDLSAPQHQVCVIDVLGCEVIWAQWEDALTLGSIEQADAAIEGCLAICGGAAVETVKACALPLLLLMLGRLDAAGRLPQLPARMSAANLASFGAIDSVEHLRRWLHGLTAQALALLGICRPLSPLVRQTLDKIKKDYHTELSLKSIASFFQVGPAYLGRIFHSETGEHFHACLMEVRLEASRALLMETDLKIRDILCRIGMENQSYYNRAFKKAYGISPTAFRRQQRGAL
jgi:AraC-like DNA-binding protein/DNA-binding response OmpR family regulator